MISLSNATVADLAGLLGQRGELTVARWKYSQLLAQIALGEAYAVREPGAASPAAIAGIAPVLGGVGEIWFGVRPGGLGRLLLPVVRITRDVLVARSPAYPGGMFCLVEKGHRPGERLAALIGCRPCDVYLGTRREWSWRHELYGWRGRDEPLTGRSDRAAGP